VRSPGTKKEGQTFVADRLLDFPNAIYDRMQPVIQLMGNAFPAKHLSPQFDLTPTPYGVSSQSQSQDDCEWEKDLNDLGKSLLRLLHTAITGFRNINPKLEQVPQSCCSYQCLSFFFRFQFYLRMLKVCLHRAEKVGIAVCEYEFYIALSNATRVPFRFLLLV
jgi:hypothetical protein